MLSAAPGVELGLDELLEMRHRLHEARLFSSQNRRSPLVGLHHSRLRGRGVDFDQVRIYQPGDDVRTIDWRVTARTREPHTKLFHEERERPVFVLVEQSQRLFFGSGLCFKAVLAARAAAFIGWSALAHNDRIGGLVFSDRDCHEIKPRRSKHSLCNCSTSYCGPIASCARRRPSGLANCSAWPCAAPAKCCARAA